MSDEWTRHATDPDGRDVMFDVGSHLHLARRQRDRLLDRVDEILQAVETREFREDDPMAGRERFYRCLDVDAARWLRVVVDFKDAPVAASSAPRSWLMRRTSRTFSSSSWS